MHANQVTPQIISPLPVILPGHKLKSLVRLWLEEDCPGMDFGAIVLGSRTGAAQLLCKSPCALAGVPFFDAVFKELNCSVSWNYGENHFFPSSELPVRVATVTGNLVDILRGERLALNVIARASGVATVCRKFLSKAVDAGWKGRIAGTRKTTPGFRLVEKYALLVAGADTHRYDLSSMVMLKDNHIWCSSGIKPAVRRVTESCSWTINVEVECGSLKDAMDAADAGAHTVMFDNFKPHDLHQAAKELKLKYPRVAVESSGGITEENISEYFGPNVDVISTSALVQGYPCADFSLKIMKDSLRT